MRFRTLFHDDVPKHMRQECCPEPPTKFGCYRPYRSALVEFDGETPIRIVGWDGGEPEDQTLTRDWDWVGKEMDSLRNAALEEAANHLFSRFAAHDWHRHAMAAVRELKS